MARKQLRMPQTTHMPNVKMPMTEAEQNAYMNRFMRRVAGKGETGPGARETEEQRLKAMLEEMGDAKTRKPKVK